MISSETSWPIVIEANEPINQTYKLSWENQKRLSDFIEYCLIINQKEKSETTPREFSKNTYMSLFSTKFNIYSNTKWIGLQSNVIGDTKKNMINYIEKESLPNKFLTSFIEDLDQPFTGESSTIKKSSSSIKTTTSIDRLLATAKEETFEDGIETQFSRKLLEFIFTYGKEVVDQIADIISSGRVNSDVGAETLRWLGRIKDPATYYQRRWLLENSLFSKNPKIRDGACIGIASMDDSHSINYLRTAIERERILPLREDMELVLRDLEAENAIFKEN